MERKYCKKSRHLGWLKEQGILYVAFVAFLKQEITCITSNLELKFSRSLAIEVVLSRPF